MITYVSIDSIAEMVRGITFAKADGSSKPEEGKLPVIRAGSIQQELLVNEGQIWIPEEKIKKNQIIKKNDIIMCTSSGSSNLVGKCAKANDDWIGSFGAFCAGIRPDIAKCDPRYLYYFLCSPTFRNWSGASDGANIKNIRTSELAKFKIPLPPLETQKKIAAVLEKADQLRKDCQQMEQELNSLAQSVFIDMFGDPLTNPKGFRVRKLKELYDSDKTGTKCGPFGSALKKEEFVDTGVPVWNMSNISLTGEFIDSPSLWITEDKYKDLESYKVFQGDVIISRAGTVGKMGVVTSEYDKSIISTNLIRVRFGEDLLPIYFVCLMTYCKTRLKRLKVGDDGSFSHMNTGILDNIEFPYPPMEEQLKYIKFRETLDLQIGCLNLLKGEQELNFNSLTQKAFKGELNL